MATTNISDIADRITSLSQDERSRIMSKEKSESLEVNELKEIMQKLTTNNLVKLLTLVKSNDKSTAKKRKSRNSNKDENEKTNDKTNNEGECIKKKKAKKEKDPNAPKRPANAYILFSLIQRKEFIDQGMDYKEALKECGTIWKAMDETARKPYIDEANEKKKIYLELMEKYNNLLKKDLSKD